MNNNVCAVFNGTNQVGRSERVIDNERKTVAVCNFRNRVDVRNIGIRISQGFDVNCLGVFADGAFDFRKIVRIDECRPNAKLGERVLE